MKKLLLILPVLFATQFLQAQDSLVNYEDINGKKQGYWLKTNESGVKIYEGYFKNNVPVGEFKRFYPDGQISWLMYYNPKDQNDVRVTMYDGAGELTAKGKYYNKQRDSVWAMYGQNEVLVKEESYNKGKLDGPSITYWESETHLPAEIKNWKNDVKEGDWTWFYDGGNVRMKAHYTNNKLNGDFIVYFIDGSIHVKGKYINDYRHGKWQYFNDDGTERATIVYNMGKVVNEDEYERAETERLNKQLENVPDYKEPDPNVEDVKEPKVDPDPDDPENFLDNPEEFIMRDKGIEYNNQQQQDPKGKKKKKK